MKKRIVFFSTVLTALSLMAFGFINWNTPTKNKVKTTNNKIASFDQKIFNKKITEEINDQILPGFFCSLGTRFGPIKKSTIDKSTSITDFLSKEELEKIVSYQSVTVTILDDTRQTAMSETGSSPTFTHAQIQLLQSINQSTNIVIRTYYQEKNKRTGKLENNYSSPHLTIVPEKQAVYADGSDELIWYIKKNSEETLAIAEESKLQPGKVYFTVTETGAISNVKLANTSGYPAIDKKMLELIAKAPGKWEPAENAKGEKVEQTLVFSFGLAGC